MNVVGYKVSSSTFAEGTLEKFYMNVVGYKEEGRLNSEVGGWGSFI